MLIAPNMGNRYLRKGLNQASPLLRTGNEHQSRFRSPPSRSMEPKLLKPMLSSSISTQRIQHHDSNEELQRAPRQSYNRNTHKRCIKCHEVKPLEEFGFHGDSHTKDNRQVVCTECKNARAKERRNLDPRARLRHHISTRVLTQLGSLAPEGITANLDKYLGYSMTQLVKHLSAVLKVEYPGKKLRDVLNDGWHVDHLYPLSRFQVVVGSFGAETVDWDVFKRCWALSNLKAIPAADNLAKGAKV